MLDYGYNLCGSTPCGTNGAKVVDTREFIAEQVASNDVVLFMKGTAQSPQCGFSAQVVKILDHLDVVYRDIDVLASDDLRRGIKEFSDWPTVPQLYVKGQFQGGCDIVREMFQSGELKIMLVDNGVKKDEGALA
jgi:monothiol glutaredoxin